MRRVLADNPSKFTFRGTGTYIVGHGRGVAVIDPGPMLDAHREALARALAGDEVAYIVVTHCHADHSPLAAWLAAETGAPTVAFGPHVPMRPEVPPPAKATEEAIDTAFAPDLAVTDGDVIAGRRLVAGGVAHPRPHGQPHLLGAAPRSGRCSPATT